MIFCCGEALIDMVPITSADGREGFSPAAGGAIFNTAVALGRLGIKAGFVSGLSNDLFGQTLVEVLHASHVDTTYAIRSDRPTTLAFVRLTDGHATYTFYDENTAGRMITPEDLPDLPETATALYFGGISLCPDPAGATYQAFMQAHAASKVTMIDPNIRQGFITDPDGYRARIMAMIGMADIVKLSDEDLDWLLEGAQTPEEKLAVIAQMGPSLSILTKGSEGAYALSAAGPVSVAARKAIVKDTVGAGDTFNAGVLASLEASGVLTKVALADVSEGIVAKALDFGAQVAAVTVSRDGANPPWANELQG
ncbi:carbohydrate kinase family protein [Algirhabdus cladophorae]|uniref:carbohydrate kinase family protein n=1 Tax=Algirhabdus cladophorae TaxID=3377108 RepID=UPI003B8477F1